MTDLADVLIENDANAGRTALRFEHRNDIACGAIAEELAQGLLVIGDVMPLDQCDEVVRRVAGERRAGEMRIGG